jgi:hypothetical protein
MRWPAFTTNDNATIQLASTYLEVQEIDALLYLIESQTYLDAIVRRTEIWN